MRTGEVFAGKYVLEEELGRGGMGVVWLATDTTLDRRVALKVMSTALNEDQTFRRRFRQEAASAAGLEGHPNVVPVHAYGEHDGVLYLEMRYVGGRDLAAELADVGRLPLARTARVVTDVAEALDAAHARGLVHRDVKPGNVLLGRAHDGRERALLTDFGLAKPVAGSSTSTGAVIGTFAYLSPEQLHGEAATPRSDVYALACVAYECLAGSPPYSGTAVEVATAHVLHPVPDLRAQAPAVPTVVAAVVRRGLDPEPERRSSSAGELAAALAAAVEEHEVETRAMALRPAARRLPPPRSPLPDQGPPQAFIPIRPRAADPQATPPDPTVLADWRSPPPPPPRRRRRGRALLAVAVLLGGLGVGAVLAMDREPPATPVAGGAAAPPVTVPEDDPRAELATVLPAQVYRDCQPLPEREGGGRTASLTCASAQPGADELLVTQWADTASMRAEFARNAGRRYPDGVCRTYTADSGPGLRSTWRGGLLACYVNTQDHGVLLYGYDDRAVQVAAVRRDKDMPALFAWWRDTRDVPFVG